MLVGLRRTAQSISTTQMRRGCDNTHLALCLSASVAGTPYHCCPLPYLFRDLRGRALVGLTSRRASHISRQDGSGRLHECGPSIDGALCLSRSWRNFWCTETVVDGIVQSLLEQTDDEPSG